MSSVAEPKTVPSDTTEAPLALLGERLVGQIIDDFVAFLLFVVCGVGFMNTDFAEPAQTAGMLVALAYLLLSDSFGRGQSYGKRPLNIAVVDSTTGQSCNVWQSFLRNALLLALGPVDWVFIFGSSRRRLGDFAAGTKVIRVFSDDLKP